MLFFIFLDYRGEKRNFDNQNKDKVLFVEVFEIDFYGREKEPKARFIVEIADNDEERRIGLMNRKSLDKDYGMLFIFGEERVLKFWMKNTLIPLDIIFIDKNGKIIKIVAANPCLTDPCETFSSDLPALYVLEINQGLTAKYGIKAGDFVKFV